MTMKEFFEIMEKDIHKENFTKREMVIYGIVAPLVFFAVVAMVGYFNA